MLNGLKWCSEEGSNQWLDRTKRYARKNSQNVNVKYTWRIALSTESILRHIIPAKTFWGKWATRCKLMIYMAQILNWHNGLFTRLSKICFSNHFYANPLQFSNKHIIFFSPQGVIWQKLTNKLFFLHKH